MFHVTSTCRLSPTIFCSFGNVIWQLADDELVERTVTHMTDDLKFIFGLEMLAGFEEPLQVGREFIGA